MAQFDSSIALQTQGLRDPLESYGKALTLKSLGQQQAMQERQLAKYDQDQEQERTLADLYRSSTDQTGKLDRNALLSGAASRGLGARIPTLQKGFADTDKTTSDAEASKLKVQKEKLDLAGGAISSLLANPNVTHEDVIGTVSSLVNQGIIQADQGAQMVRMLPGNPQALRQFLVAKGIETMDAAKRMELVLPKYQTVDGGNRVIQGTTSGLTGEFTPGQAAPITKAPEGYTVGPDGQLAVDPGFLNSKKQIAAAGASNVNYGTPMAGVDDSGKPVFFQPTKAGGAPSIVPGVRPPKDPNAAKVSSEVQRQIGGIVSFDKDLSALEEALKDFNPRNPRDQLDTTKRARIQSLSKQAQLSAKEAAALGALSGPDMALLEGILNDPTNAKGMVSGSSGLAAQISEARAGNKRRVKSIEQQYGAGAIQGLPGELKGDTSTTPAAPKPGAAEGGYVFLGGDPADQKNWKKQ